MDQTVEKIKGIKIKFTNDLNDNIKNVIRNELEIAIKYFEKTASCCCRSYIEEIIIKYESIKISNNFNINGIFNQFNRVMTLSYNGDVSKFKNTIIHELTHAKFNTDLAINNTELWRKSMEYDSAIYMINEYMAIKYSSNYCYTVEDFKHVNSCQNNFKDYYKFRENYNIDNLKTLATFICSIIISEEILKRNRVKMYRVYIKDILDIKKELEKIDFIPTEEQYQALLKLLKEKGYKEYN
ncbi:MAG: hypothetical protein E7F83_16265 [Clostridium sp.]|uniref:hypothetical protein n=1 Tax=Clostridium sp. TaxID=1506 RepID=UPI00290EF47D|nr:hypothetical protein [Clostridium sp.]MDU3548961.1 hypothetical protein [Clostridium sp.]